MSDQDTQTRLNELRQSLDVVDQTLVELTAKRQAIVSEIGAIKAQSGRQLRDFRREREVLDGVRAHAQSLNVDPDLAEDLVSRLIEASLTRQEREQVKRAHRGEGKSALVIGGAGRLGGWLVNFLDAQGFVVTVADPAIHNAPDERLFSDWRLAGVAYDVVVLATPPGVTSGLLSELAEIQPQGLIFDVGSIKSPMIDALRQATDRGLKVCSIHPMFGPNTDLLSGRHVLLMNTGSDMALEEAKALFSDTMAETVIIPLDAHDRLMALVLGLSHAINIAFLLALAESGVSARELGQLSSTTFERQLAIARDVANESPSVYYEIQKLNDYGQMARDALARATALISEAVLADEPGAFTELMARGRQYFQSRPTD